MEEEEPYHTSTIKDLNDNIFKHVFEESEYTDSFFIRGVQDTLIEKID